MTSCTDNARAGGRASVEGDADGVLEESHRTTLGFCPVSQHGKSELPALVHGSCYSITCTLLLVSH